MVTFLVVLSGLAWTVAYVDCVRVGLRDRTYAMPLVALGLNIAWESTYAVHGFAGGLSAQTVINVVWALADLAIVGTFVRFGRSEFPGLGPRLFAGGAVLVFAASFAVQWLFIGEFGWSGAARYSAFLQNLLMSGMFVAMFVARRGTRGQSRLIAVAKGVGTLAPTLVFGVHEHAPFILGLGILCAVLDAAYVALVWSAPTAAVDAPTPAPAAAVSRPE